jgi:hypothetical protein
MGIVNGLTIPNNIANGNALDAPTAMANWNALLVALNRALLDAGNGNGMNAQGSQIHNLAAGTATADAVNVGQLATAPYLPLAGGTLTGAVSGVTPTQFDAGGSLATTAFVQRALGSMSGLNLVGSSTTLTASAAGQWIQLNASTAFTITLPAGSSLPAGSVIRFMSISTPSMTIAAQGTDFIYANGLSGNLTSIALNSGDTIELLSRGYGEWDLIGGTVSLRYASATTPTPAAGDNSTKLATTAFVQTAIAAKVPLPQSATGVGQWVPLTLVGGNTYSYLPAGGTWAYSGANNGTGFTGVAAGVTSVWSGTATNFFGFAWRIA